MKLLRLTSLLRLFMLITAESYPWNIEEFTLYWTESTERRNNGVATSKRYCASRLALVLESFILFTSI